MVETVGSCPILSSAVASDPMIRETVSPKNSANVTADREQGTRGDTVSELALVVWSRLQEEAGRGWSKRKGWVRRAQGEVMEVGGGKWRQERKAKTR